MMLKTGQVPGTATAAANKTKGMIPTIIFHRMLTVSVYSGLGRAVSNHYIFLSLRNVRGWEGGIYKFSYFEHFMSTLLELVIYLNLFYIK